VADKSHKLQQLPDPSRSRRRRSHNHIAPQVLWFLKLASVLIFMKPSLELECVLWLFKHLWPIALHCMLLIVNFITRFVISDCLNCVFCLSECLCFLFINSLGNDSW